MLKYLFLVEKNENTLRGCLAIRPNTIRGCLAISANNS